MGIAPIKWKFLIDRGRVTRQGENIAFCTDIPQGHCVTQHTQQACFAGLMCILMPSCTDYAGVALPNISRFQVLLHRTEDLQNAEKAAVDTARTAVQTPQDFFNVTERLKAAKVAVV
jgi:hypothetical protein